MTGDRTEMSQHEFDRFGDRVLVRSKFNVRVFGRLIWGRDAGEIFQLSGARPGIKSFGIAALAHLNRRIDVNLDELLWPHDTADDLPIGTIRRDERGDANKPGIGKQPRYFAHSTDVFLSIFGGEPEV